MKTLKTKLIFLVILVLVLVFASLRLSLGVSSTVSAIGDLQTRLQKETFLPSVDELQNRIVSLRGKRPLLNAYLIDFNNPINFIEFVENLAISHNLSYGVDNVGTVDISTEIEIADGKKTERLGGELTMSVTISGSINSIRNFIFSVENFEKEVFIESVRISKQDLEGTTSWNSIITIKGITN
jgi:hypothetical protein